MLSTVDVVRPPNATRARRWQRWRRGQLTDVEMGVLLLAPCFLVLGVFAAYPVSSAIWQSFVQGRAWVGLQNYSSLLSDGYFWDSLAVTGSFVAVTVASQTVLGLFMALITHRVLFIRGLARTALLLPWAMPPVIAALAWRWMANDTFGLFNDVLIRLHILKQGVVWLGSPDLAMWALMALAIWKMSSFMGLLMLAGLQTIPEELYEAASIDGASSVGAFFRITLPLLKPTILVAVLLRLLQSVQVFDLPYALTGGGPGNATQTLGMYIYRTTFIELDFGRGSAQTVVLLGISLVFALVYFGAVRRQAG